MDLVNQLMLDKARNVKLFLDLGLRFIIESLSVLVSETDEKVFSGKLSWPELYLPVSACGSL